MQGLAGWPDGFDTRRLHHARQREGDKDADHSRRTWKAAFDAAGVQLTGTMRVTPFVVFVLHPQAGNR